MTLDSTKGSCSRSEILEPNEVLPKSNISPKDQPIKFSTPSIARSLVNTKKIKLRNMKLDEIRTAKIWLQFQEIFIIQDNKFSYYAICKDCLQAYKVYSTINNELKKSNGTSTISRHVSNCTNKKNKSISPFLCSEKIIKLQKKQDRINTIFLHYIVSSGSSFISIENKNLTSLFNYGLELGKAKKIPLQ